MGRPTFTVTNKMRLTVKTMAGLGCRSEDIATMLGVTGKTLRKHFRAELDLGMMEANAKVMKSLFEMATSGKNTAAAIFWAKTRCGMKGETGAGGEAGKYQSLITLRVDGELGN